MRQIKFRAWDCDNKRFIPPEDFHLMTLRFDGTPQFWTGDDVLIHGKEWPKNIIVQQYAGVKDIYGKEIYEGDIVHIGAEFTDWIAPPDGAEVWIGANDAHEGWYNSGQVAKIVFSDGCFVFYFNGYHYAGKQCIKVIGNIYENPELYPESRKEPVKIEPLPKEVRDAINRAIADAPPIKGLFTE